MSGPTTTGRPTLPSEVKRHAVENLSHPQPLPPPGSRSSLGKRGEPDSIVSPFPAKHERLGEGLGERF